MTLWKWSKTANTNQTADSSVPAAEGQSPGSLNQGIRGVMAGVAKLRDDIGGGIDTAGTSTAYTLTTNQVYTALGDLQDKLIVFTPHANNGTPCTLAVDGLAAKPLRPSPGVEFAANQLVLGVPYIGSYNGTEIVVFGLLGNVLAGNADLIAIEALAGTSGGLKKTAADTWALDNFTFAIEFIKDNNGTVIPTGIAGDFDIPIACTITGVKVLADQAGSMVIDIWKDTYANYPPTVADTIVAAAKPTLVSASKFTDTTLTGWTTSVTAGDTFRVNVDSCTTITRFTLVLTCKRFA